MALVDYRGMSLPENPTGDGGVALNENFTALAQRAPKCNLTATTDPGVGDDVADGYYPGSRWLNTSSNKVFTCIDSSSGAAVWVAGGSADASTLTEGELPDARLSANIPRIYRTSVVDPSTDTLTVTHGLGQQYVQVTVFDENDLQIMMDEVTATSTTVVTLDKTTYGSVTGTWHIIVVG